ncbi:ParB/RepB/Spo0J family partition protein [Phenylobacterium sp.]|uniref:ParB/RepB/Spo0J family partition protein n=1 Tax=Phenylobacterium sp. TaxID=1871053 RepID=UPI00272FCEB1|nr:ParB/RepB/Spo0J family partition protein [Phenylobacterium sp.]MDP2214739.1 ParB/RepB/Spo0J family partition protein [Phenylobacterium sp.]
MKALTRLAVENRTLLDHLETHGAPKSVEEFARILERDPSNFRKTLKALAAEGWLLLGKAAGGEPVQLTDDGHQAAKGLQVAEGRLRAGLPPLIHAQITPDPNQPRKDFETAEALEGLGELAENIADRGLLQPILVRLTGPDRADLVAGERRWRAIALLIDKADPRWPADRPIPYHVSAQSDEAEILADQVVENLQRKGLHPLEEGLAFQQLKQVHGWGVGQISKAVTRTRKFVEQRLDLMNLTPDLQARMRLPKENPQHLTFSRAREMLHHLRQINDKTAEQRDLEEIAPGGALAAASPEDLDAARKPKLEPRDLLALGEIAAAAALNPSQNFPDSPVPVVEIDWTKAMASQSAIRLENAKLAQLLINGDATPKVAGARLQPLGHIRLRQENLHPADNPRALFHLRREAGLSADQARQMGNLGRWATPFLTLATPPAEKVEARPEPQVVTYLEKYRQPCQGSAADLPFGDVKSVDWWPAAEQLMALEIADRILRHPAEDFRPGEGWTEISRIPDSGERGQLHGGMLEFARGDDGRFFTKLHFSAGEASSGGGVHGALTRLGLYRNRQEALHRARMAAGALDPDDFADGQYLYDWLNLSTPTGQSPFAGSQDTLAAVEIRILREVAHAQARVGGDPARVGPYWLDGVAVGLWKREPKPLLQFAAKPGETWTVELTPAALDVLKALASDYDPLALQMRIEREGRYESDWLNPTPVDSATAEETDTDLPIEADPEEPPQFLEQVREGIAAGAGDFAQLLALAGLEGPFTAHEPTAEIRGENGKAAACVDPWRDETEDLALVRAELTAFALNLAAGHVAPPLQSADELQAELHRTGRALLDTLARIIPPATPLFMEVGAAYEPFAKALNAAAWASRAAAAEPTPQPLLEIRTGDVVTKGGAMTWRLLEPIAKPGARAHAFKAQPILHGKDYGKATTISLADITALIEERS